MNDLVERNGLYYKKFTDIPFTGELTGIESGKIKLKVCTLLKIADILEINPLSLFTNWLASKKKG